MKLWNYIREHLTVYTKQTISEKSSSLTFEEVAVWAEIFSEKLKKFNCCAILCSSQMAAAMSLLACFAADVTALPLSVLYGNTHCNKILDIVSPDAIIMDINGEIDVYKLENSRYVTPAQHAALIMCTSGTTGNPKGIMLSEENIITNVSDIAEYFSMGLNDTILIARPLYHCARLFRFTAKLFHLLP